MYFKIVFLLLILSSITNSEDANSTTGPTEKIETTTEVLAPPDLDSAEVETLPSEPEITTKPAESKESDPTPEQKPNPDPKPEDKKEENKEDAKPGSNDPPKEPIKDETKPEPETPEKPNEKKEPETPAPKQPEKASRTGLKKGSVWGIAIGVIGMVATTGFLVVYILKRRRGDDRLIR